MTFLLDTNVVSELRRGTRANAGVREWRRTITDTQVRISVMVLGEIRSGIELLRHRDPTQADVLERWSASVRRNYRDAVLPVDDDVADQWGRLKARAPLPLADGLMAATALVHDLTFVTRNVRDVENTGARLLNPFT